MEIEQFQKLQKRSQSLKQLPIPVRIDLLKKLEASILSNITAIENALSQDFAKPPAETLLTEIYPVIKEINFFCKNLNKWARPQKVRTSLSLIGTQSYIVPEPLGVCLIISPWNYPFNLGMIPLISAIAAGNNVVLKPSEWTPHTNNVLKKIITEVFPSDYVTVQEGDGSVTKTLLRLPFDHVFFTGSTEVGRLVMEAAAKNLSRVTLELGGKSPTIIDETCDLDATAEKIAWAKFLNGGQTCIAPDYLLVQENILPNFRKILIEKIQKFYTAAPSKIPYTDLARIISPRHCQRLQDLLSEALKNNATISFGGQIEVSECFAMPTIVENLTAESRLLTEEIFGPILPILPFKKISEAITYINDRPKPLALYIFSDSKENVNRVITETSSGGICHNEAILQLSSPYLPFGGVGESGMGRYHGHFGFKTFSHEKPLMKRSWLGNLMKLTHPPYSSTKLSLIRALIKFKI